MTMDYSPWSKGKFGRFEGSNISKTREVNRLNFSMTMDYIEREIWSFLTVAIYLKPKRSHSPKFVCMLVTCVYTFMNFLS